MGEHTGLLHSVSVILAACGRRMTRASRKLRSSSRRLRSLEWRKTVSSGATHLSQGGSMSTPRGGGMCENKGLKWRKGSDYKGGSSSEELGDGVWRKTILLGEKCQPPDFAGVIYYDSQGNRLTGPPRSPLRSPLPTFSFPATPVHSGRH